MYRRLSTAYFRFWFLKLSITIPTYHFCFHWLKLYQMLYQMTVILPMHVPFTLAAMPYASVKLNV